MTEPRPAIVWFRQDLRITDNPALTAAVESGSPIFPVYVLDDANAGAWRMGGASRWWLHQSLKLLDVSLDGRLSLYRGKADEVIPQLAHDLEATGVYWNRCYEPWRVKRDRRIKAAMREEKRKVYSFNGSLLFEPHTVAKADGSPYKVFTPFFRNGCLGSAPEPRFPIKAPEMTFFSTPFSGLDLQELRLMPSKNWYAGIAENWTPGERGALRRLDDFLADGIHNYREGRNRPDQNYVSRLSPHLHFGEISPHQAWHAVNTLRPVARIENDVDHFLSELGWREFSHYLLNHWPGLPRENMQKKFDRFPWRDDADSLERWQKGLTGYPIVDAGMRELWQTGYMHNRVRMITGSFLVKNLMLHWHHGEDWFWDTLVDADLANNSAGWQWIAGCGADAAPYFRIFNPVTQGTKFDPQGDYVRRYVPELAKLPDKYIHNPWQAPRDVLVDAGIRIGKDYPQPVVDLKASRERALEAFRSLAAGD